MKLRGSFDDRRQLRFFGLGVAKGYEKMLEVPDPSNLIIDYDDAESVLNAAGILDQHGEWDRAVKLYQHASRTWPEEHGKYAENCLAEIREKTTDA